MRQATDQPIVEDPPVDLRPLQELVVRLRAPDGCPWDREQTLDDLRAYVVEEAHEVAAALDAGDSNALSEELGDLLFQVVFIGRLAAEEGSFHLREVADSIHRKMVARHPHVFGDAERPADARGVVTAWEQRKSRQREGSLLDGVPTSLPALTAAYRMTQKASGLGFDWSSPRQVLAKVREELAELSDALDQLEAGKDVDKEADSDIGETEAGQARQAEVAEELGDLLFSVANLARHLGLDPEASLARGNSKFRRRFGRLEEIFKERGSSLEAADLETMDEVWNDIKEEEGRG